MRRRTPSPLRRLLSELRNTWLSPAAPPPIPALRDYPARRRI
jgi:hypothetical protein